MSHPFEGRFNIVSLTDWHIPFEDAEAIKAAFVFCKKIQPQILVIHETHDFYSLSKFNKNPQRLDTLQDELDKVCAYFDILRRACPKSRIILLDSNHLRRLKHYLWSTAPGLHSLRALQVEELLELEKYRIEFKESFIYNNFLFKHGDLVSVASGMTARRELEREGMSGCSGHTHRLGQIYKRNRSGEYTWMESGCLCDLRPEWANEITDWQPGISIVSFNSADSDMFYATVIPIIENQILL